MAAATKAAGFMPVADQPPDLFDLPLVNLACAVVIAQRIAETRRKRGAKGGVNHETAAAKWFRRHGRRDVETILVRTYFRVMDILDFTGPNNALTPDQRHRVNSLCKVCLDAVLIGAKKSNAPGRPRTPTGIIPSEMGEPFPRPIHDRQFQSHVFAVKAGIYAQRTGKQRTHWIREDGRREIDTETWGVIESDVKDIHAIREYVLNNVDPNAGDREFERWRKKFQALKRQTHSRPFSA
jgi:hypothetical protein